MAGDLLLYGDRRRDDTDVLEAFIRGERIKWANGEDVGHMLQGRMFRVSRHIDFRRLAKGRVILSCVFFVDGDELTSPISVSHAFYGYPERDPRKRYRNEADKELEQNLSLDITPPQHFE